MDEQAQVDAYEIFKSGGYDGSQEEFIELISTNQDAFSDSLSMFKEGGYNGSPEEYAALIGVGSVDKKEPEEVEEEVIAPDAEFEKIDVESISKGYDEAIAMWDNPKYKKEVDEEDRQLAKAKILKEKEKAIKRIQDNPDIVDTANELEKVRIASVVTQEEIEAMDVAWDLETVYEEEEEEELSDAEKLQQQIEQNMSQSETNVNALPSKSDIFTKQKNSKYKDINRLREKAISMGYPVIADGDKIPKDKNGKQLSKDKYIKLPPVGTEDYNPKDIYPSEIIEEALYDKKKEAAQEVKLWDYKEKIDAVLEKYEDEKGVTAVAGHLFGTLLSLGDALNELTITDPKLLKMQQDMSMQLHQFIGTDKSYQENREKLDNIIKSKSDSENYRIDAAVFNIENANDNLMVLRSDLLELETKIKSGSNISEAEANKYNLLKDAYNKQIEVAQLNMRNLGQLTVNSENFDEIRDKTLDTYSTLSVYGNNIGSSIVNLGAGLMTLGHELSMPQLLKWTGVDINDAATRSKIASYVDNLVDGYDIGDEIEKGLSLVNDADRSISEGISKVHKYGNDIKAENRAKQRYEDISNPLEFISWGFEGVTENAVNIGIGAITGGSGLAIMALAETGNKMNEMNIEMEGEKWSEEELALHKSQKESMPGFQYDYFYGDRDDTYKVQPKNISALNYFGTAGIYGAAEYLSEKITLGNFKFAKNNIQKAWKNSIKKGAKGTEDFIPSNSRQLFGTKMNPASYKEQLKTWGIKTLSGTGQEAGGEGLVALTQNWADIHLLDNKDISIWDGVEEAAAMGAFMNGTMQSPMVLSQAAGAFRTEADNVKTATTGLEILNLSKKRDLLNSRLVAAKGQNPQLVKQLSADINLINDNISDLASEQLRNMKETENTIQTLTPQDRQTLIDVFNNEHKVRQEIDDINSNESLDVKEKGDMINSRLTYLAQQNSKKQRTLSNRVFNADKKRSNNFSTAWRTKSGTLNNVVTIAGKNNKEALDQGLKHIEGLSDLSQQEKSQVAKQLKNEFDRVEQESKGDYTVHGMAFGDNLTIEVQDANGNMVKKNIDIPLNFAMNSGNRTVQSHEMGHQTVFKEFMNNNPDAVGLVTDLEAYVKKNYGNAYNVFLETKEAYKEADGALLAEEKLAALSDFMRKKNLKGMRTLHNKLFGRFQKFNDGSSQQIKSGKDVFDMLTSYNQSFETGSLKGLTKGLAEGTVKVGKSAKSKTKKDSSTKKSMTKGEKDSVEDTLNDAPGQRNKDGKYTMTKAEWRADKNRAFSKAYNALMNGDLDGLIIAKMASGKDIFGQAREEFIEDAKLKIGQHMLNFDPQGRDSLFGWVNAYIGKRVGDVANKAKREKAKQPGTKISTDQKIGEEGRTIGETIADDTDIEAQIDENIVDDTIDNLRTKLGIEKDGPIYNKVLDSVRKVLGTKLPEVSNKNFREDLKKAFDKELFKEIKKFIGTRANYETFLSENFNTVFDNISQSTANKRFRQFVEPLIDPATGKQARPDNNPLFRKKNIKRSEFMNYFLGSDVGASTKGTRKDALAGAIAQELAFDATMEVLDDPAVQNRIKDIYELQGLRQAENYTAVVGKTIDRIPGSKFSRSKVKGQPSLRQDQVIDEINLLNDFLNSQDEKIRQGFDLAEIVDSYIDKQSVQVKDALNKYVFKLKQIASKHKNTPITLDTFKQLREGGPEGTLKFVSSMPAFIKDQANIENFELKTEAGTEQYFDFITELTSIMDPSFTDSSIFKSTIGRGGKKIFYDSKTGGVKRLNTNEASNIISKGNKQKLKFDPKKAIAISSAQYNKIDSLMKSYTVDQRNDPKIQKKIAKQITDILGKEKMEAIQAARDYLYSKLNEYVQSQKTPAARNKAIANVAKLLEIQSSLTSGIPRQGAVPTTISLNFSEVATKKKRDGTEVPKLYHKEHNLPQVVFNANVLASIIGGDFDQVYPQISKTYNQSILDTDIQLAQDYGLVSKEFYAKYPSAQLINTGRTAEMTGYEMGMDSEALFLVATGNAPFQLDLKTGLTLDKVIYNKLGSQDAMSYIGKVSDMISKDLSKSVMGNTILNSKNKDAIFSSKENSDLFNEIITNSVNNKNIDNQTIELGIKLNNQESYNQRDKANNDLMADPGIVSPFSKSKNTTKEVLDEATVLDKALNIARDPNAPIKKIRVFDFDDTLARTKSNVLYTMPDGTTGKLTAEQFAKDGDAMLAEGAVWDFSEFNKVMNGKKGPLFEVAQKIQEARGTKDVFVLTARAAEAAPAIKQFLDAVGLNIPIQNITGLGNSSPLAKSNWMVNKAAEGYNDFYFADDHLGNVDAVDKAMSVIDVKSKTQQAKIKFSKTADQTINDIIEHKFGIKSEKEYSDVKAKLIGRKKGRGKFFIPPSAEDFVGLLYSMLGKGEIGDLQMEYFKDHLIEPYGRAMEDLSRDQNRMVNDFRALKSQLVKEGLIPKNLNKKAFGEFTFQDVARILAWNKQGFEVPGISKADLNEVLKFAKENPAIDVFAGSLIDINKGDGYAKPGADWLAGTISTDLLDGLRTGKRAKYLEQWQQNVDIIFSEKNLNKMEAAMGSKWREAMENMLGRMKSGKNRTSNGGRLENRLLDYVNNSVGTVMFFNMRSAILQTISSINFINWGGNNILKAGQAFANQPQYWKDFMELMNSDFLVERRNGLKLNVSESEIADAAATSKNKAKAAIAYILQKGYLPTQFADSFAIASGGATFYRNKIKELMKNGMSEADAKAQAFVEFREIAEESQQSSRPDRISQQQASGLGRVILAFANTPMQYNRLIKKAGQDLLNRRKKPGQTQLQSDFSNVSKMAYYAVIQNVIFNALQQAVFALEFDDEEDENAKQKYYNVANGMVDSILRGSGLAGVGVSTLIAMVRKVYKEAQKEGTFPGPDYADAAWELLNFSPPIDIKASKLRIAGNNWKYEGWKHDEAKWGIDDPAYKSAAYVISALTNIPVDRLFKKMDNIKGALDAEEETWKRVSQALGWTKWQLETTEDIKEFRAQEKPKKKQALKNMYGESNPEVYSKAEQQEILKGHGYSDEEIKAMKKEGERVEAILNKQKETGKVIKPKQARAYTPKKLMTVKQLKQEEEKAKLKQEEEAKQLEVDKYKKLKKPRQVEMLDSLGLTKKQIRELQYEKDRVAKLIELMNK